VDNYLILKDSSFNAKDFRKNTSIIEPLLYECSHSNNSGNDFSLKLPYYASDNIDIGDWLEYPENVAFSGMIYSKEIDKQKGVVTYRGSSSFGVLNGCPKPGVSYQRLYLYDPNGSRGSYYAADDPTNPIYNAKNVFQFLADKAGYPIRFTESKYIPQATFEALGKDYGYGYYQIDCSILTTEALSIFELLKRYYERANQKAVISRSTGGVPNKIFNIDFKPRESKVYFVTDEPAVFTTAMNYNGARNSSYLAYIELGSMPLKAKTALVSGMPFADNKYSGFMQKQSYLGHEDDVTQEELRNTVNEYLSTSLVDGKVTINPQKISADIGDLISFVDSDLGVTTDAKILREKILRIEHGNATLDFVVGG